MLREQSRRVACASNLKNWGLCAIAASTDNQGALLGSFFEGQTSAVQPQIVAVIDSYWYRNMAVMGNAVHPLARNQFTIFRMAQYMDNGPQIIEVIAAALGTTASELTAMHNSSRRIVNGVISKEDLPIASFSSFRCPSQRAGITLVPAGFGLPPGNEENNRSVSYVEGMGFSYFARSDLWKSGYGGGGAPAKYISIHAGVEPSIIDSWVIEPGGLSSGVAANVNVNGVDAVCARQAVGERVLMAETLYYNGQEAGPGKKFTGPNHIKTRSTNDARGDITKLSGNNVLMGDGRVVWKSASMMNVPEIATRLSDARQRHFIGTIE